ncbi:MAG: outer membrane beta-barrel protein [Bacteroidia bacterium]|nr:outer membrane beta-barrel protein [Bacteroidia bacterium]
MMENIIKEKFDGFEAAPSAGLFDAILAKRKRKKRLIWVWSAASILLLGTAYFGLTNLEQSSQSNNPIVEQESNSTEDLATSDLSPEETAEFKQINEEDNQASNIASNREDERFLTDEVIREESPRFVEQSTPKTIQSAPQQIEETPIRDKSLADKFLEIVKSEKNNDVKKAKFFVKDKELVVDAPRKNTKTELPKLESEDTHETDDKKVNEPKDNYQPTNQSPDDNDLGGDNPKLSKWSLAFTGGPGIGGRMLSGDQSMIDARNSAESSKLSYGFDVRAQYAFSEFWNVQTGVNYTQRNENFDYVQNSMEVSSRKETKEVTIIHPVLGEIKKEVEYTVWDTVLNSNSTSATNKYTSISIPLSIERMFPLGQKFAILTRTGVLFGINQSATGSTINQENEAILISTQPYKQAGVNRVELGIGAAYRVNNRITILVYPQGNVALQSVYKKSAIIEQRDYGFYTQFGLKIDL